MGNPLELGGRGRPPLAYDALADELGRQSRRGFPVEGSAKADVGTPDLHQVPGAEEA